MNYDLPSSGNAWNAAKGIVMLSTDWIEKNPYVVEVQQYFGLELRAFCLLLNKTDDDDDFLRCFTSLDLAVNLIQQKSQTCPFRHMSDDMVLRFVTLVKQCGTRAMPGYDPELLVKSGFRNTDHVWKATQRVASVLGFELVEIEEGVNPLVSVPENWRQLLGYKH